MKRLLLIISSLLFLLGCSESDYIRNEGDIYYKNIKILRNGVDMNQSSEVELLTIGLQSSDTIVFSYDIEVDYDFETLKIDSIEYITEHVSIGGYNELESKEAVDEVIKVFTKTVYPDLPIGNHTHSITESFVLPDNKFRNSLNGKGVDWTNRALLYFSFTEEYDYADNPEINTINSWNVMIQPNRTTEKFRVYNNYVGKNFDDSTGVGYSISNREFVNDICHLYDIDENGYECTHRVTDVLINLTYRDEVNQSSEIFIPHTGLSAFNLRFKRISSSSPSYIRIHDDSERKYFDWDRLEFTKTAFAEYTDSYDYFIPKEGMTYRVYHPATSKYTYEWFRMIAIVNDGFNSYVEFERLIVEQ